MGTNAHSVSDHTQSNWNGVIGTISLTAKPSLYIDDIQILPEYHKQNDQSYSFVGRNNRNERFFPTSSDREEKNGSIVGKPYKIEITSGSGIIQEATLAMGDDAQL